LPRFLVVNRLRRRSNRRGVRYARPNYFPYRKLGFVRIGDPIVDEFTVLFKTTTYNFADRNPRFVNFSYYALTTENGFVLVFDDGLTNLLKRFLDDIAVAQSIADYGL
jgi:hypothetical protein